MLTLARSLISQRWFLAVLGLAAGYVLAFAVYRTVAQRRGPALITIDGGQQRPLSRRVSIGTFNIAHGRGIAELNTEGGDAQSRDQRLDDIARLLRTEDADLWVLNEVDFDSAWSYSQNQAELLAERAGYRYVATQNNLDVPGWVPSGPYTFGNAILSKVPLSDCAVLDLPGLRGWETALAGKKRGLSCRVGGKTGFDLYAVHLSHRSERLRVESVRMLVQKSVQSRVPVVIAGDFNSAPQGVAGHAVDDRGRNALDDLVGSQRFKLAPGPATSHEEMTFHSQRPTSVIDWVAAPRSWVNLGQRVVDTDLSDHRPVVVRWLRRDR